MTNVLVPLDGSSYGKVIADFIVNHRWTAGTQIKLLLVIESLAADANFEDSSEQDVLATAQKLLSEIEHKLVASLPATTVTQAIKFGVPQEKILNEASNWPADLIVLGSHRHHDPNQSRIGSVALSVLGESKSTVIIVRVPPEKIKDMSMQSENEILRARYKYCNTLRHNI